MSQLFPRYSNTLARVMPIAGIMGIGGLAWGVYIICWSPFATEAGMAVEQPVPFSHQHHVGQLGIDCRYCHTGVETSAFAGLPSTETCMTCHSQVWRDAPMLAPVRDSWTSGKPLHWVRVNKLPDYTYFNHSIHVQKGVSCVSCHGRVDQMPLMAKAESLYMRWCLDCHRAPENHLQPESEVFAMKDGNAADRKQGIDLVKARGINPDRLSDCSICHR